MTAGRTGFDGFPRDTVKTPIPNLFFSRLLPAISDRAELVVTLYALYALSRKRGYPRFVSFAELANDTALVTALSHDSPDGPGEALQRGLQLAAQRGSLIEVSLERNGQRLPLYFLNAESDRRAAELVRQGRINLGLPLADASSTAPMTVPPSIFALYEQNVGQLTPIITEQLKDAAERYPDTWIADAIEEAVKAGVHRWSYISAILERWAREGRDNEEDRRDTQEPTGYPGKLYGHLFRHRR